MPDGVFMCTWLTTDLTDTVRIKYTCAIHCMPTHGTGSLVNPHAVFGSLGCIGIQMGFFFYNAAACTTDFFMGRIISGIMISGTAFCLFFVDISTEETVVLLSHKKADSYIHIDVEFGEGEGKIPVDSIAKRAEAYKPKEKVTYKMIKEYIEAKYGFKVHTAYIAEVKRNLGLPMYDAPNAVEELKQPRKHPTPEKVEAIKDALRYFAVI